MTMFLVRTRPPPAADSSHRVLIASRVVGLDMAAIRRRLVTSRPDRLTRSYTTGLRANVPVIDRRRNFADDSAIYRASALAEIDCRDFIEMRWELPADDPTRARMSISNFIRSTHGRKSPRCRL